MTKILLFSIAGAASMTLAACGSKTQEAAERQTNAMASQSGAMGDADVSAAASGGVPYGANIMGAPGSASDEAMGSSSQTARTTAGRKGAMSESRSAANSEAAKN